MHLENNQENIPVFLAHAINVRDHKYSYYCDHYHALACGIEPGSTMEDICMKEVETYKGYSESMNIFDKDKYLHGGWTLVS